MVGTMATTTFARSKSLARNNPLWHAARAIYRSCPPVRNAYRAIKRQRVIVARALFHVRDAVHSYRHMRWDARKENYWNLSAQLFFYYHKLEKGLCIPGKKRFFGAEPALIVTSLVDRWSAADYPKDDPVYLGALECLRAYRARLAVTPPPSNVAEALFARIDACLAGASVQAELATPIPARKCVDTQDVLLQLCTARRSVRSYRPDAVPLDELRAAIATAQLSPSACNRQPWHVHVYRDRPQMDALLALQNGNRGFGHEIPVLLIITAEASGFFDASERKQPYIDAGLFTMTLLLALQSRGLATCCLNWCITDPALDTAAHRLGNIPESEIIMMYLAVGYPADDALVPRSVRRDIDSFLIVH